MAQTMLLMQGVSSTNLKQDVLLQFQLQKLKPKSSFSSSYLILSPLHSSSSTTTTTTTTLKTFALFKSKPKAPPPKKVVEKPKSGGEGIFGTSGKIGFTKENELFVGRVAMIGFAVKKPKGEDKEEIHKLMKNKVAQQIMTLLHITLLSFSLSSGSLAVDGPRGAALFHRACIGCHDTGGNIIQPGSTLFTQDLQRNGVSSEEEIFRITYYGKGRMPGFGEKCMPKGKCTFGPRLEEEEIRILAQFVKLQAELGWPNIDIYGD